MKDKILVTGATGFIGSHLAEKFLSKGGKIRCLVLKKDDILGKENEKRAEMLKEKGAEIVYGDLRDKKSIEEALREIKTVYHLGGIGRPMPFARKIFFDVNFKGTRNLLESCVEKGIKKVIFVSSISAIGFSRDGKAMDEKTKCIPVSIYGESKLEAEKIALDFADKGMNTTIIRPPMVFGERDFQFLTLFRAIKTGLFPLLNPETKFEFCYVRNLIDGIILVGKKGRNGEIYNFSDNAKTTGEVFRKIAKKENARLIDFVPAFSVRMAGLFMEALAKITCKKPIFNRNTAIWMMKSNVINSAKIKKLGYKPRFGIDEAIEKTIRWYKENGYI